MVTLTINNVPESGATGNPDKTKVNLQLYSADGTTTPFTFNSGVDHLSALTPVYDTTTKRMAYTTSSLSQGYYLLTPVIASDAPDTDFTITYQTD